MAESGLLALSAFRRLVADNYAEVRRLGADPVSWLEWRARRDAIFRDHPESPVPASARARFRGMAFHEYDPSWRLLATVEDAAGGDPASAGPAADPSGARFTRIGVVVTEREGQAIRLPLLWLEGYGGGLFLPFRDATSGDTTYGGGRYLLDQAKGADLGVAPDGRLVLDFNFAYHPSCAHDARWTCPLAPPDAAIAGPVRAGELLPQS